MYYERRFSCSFLLFPIYCFFLFAFLCYALDTPRQSDMAFFVFVFDFPTSPRLHLCTLSNRQSLSALSSIGFYAAPLPWHSHTHARVTWHLCTLISFYSETGHRFLEKMLLSTSHIIMDFISVFHFGVRILLHVLYSLYSTRFCPTPACTHTKKKVRTLQDIYVVGFSLFFVKFWRIYGREAGQGTFVEVIG